MPIRDVGERPPSPVFSQPQSVSARSSEQKGRKKDWVGSASKRLRLPKLREKRSLSQVQEASMPSKESAQKPIVGPAKSSVATPVAAQLTQKSTLERPGPTKQSSSPTDKPLPSLPVATVDYKSPVRRSLIDCSERPLRRSVSPPDGGPPKEEEWPSIQPSTGTTVPIPEPCKAPAKPSLGESIIDGLRSLNLQDNEDEKEKGYPAVEFANSAVERKKESKSHSSGRQMHTSLGILDNDSDRPLSSSQLPKPRDSMLQSLSRHTDNPVIRQTKTSAMRLQNAMGKRTWSSGEKSVATEDALPSIQQPSTLLGKPRHIDGRGPNPTRSASKGRHAVTVRGSPYIIPTRVPLRANAAPPANQQEMTHDDHSMMISQGLKNSISHGLDHVGRKEESTAKDVSRQSSLPVPSRIKGERASPGTEGVSPHGQPSLDETSKPTECPGTQGSSGAASTNSSSPRVAGQSPPVADSCIDLRDALSSPVPPLDHTVGSADISNSTTRGYDSYGGFRIKHLGNGLLEGPTLRINDSASRILLGSDEKASDPVAPSARSSVLLRRKRSAPEIGQRKDTKTSSQPTSAIFDRPLSFIARNIADRTSEIRALGDDEVRQLIGDCDSPSQPQSAELPGRESVYVHDSRPSSLIIKYVKRDSWESPRNPAPVQCDWPGKDFAEFNLCASPDRSPPKLTSPSFYEQGDPGKSKSSIYTDAELPTIALRAPLSREIAPFLFQDTKNVGKKGKESVRKVSVRLEVSGSAGSGDSTTTYPPRVSSRRPKPPPIIVLPPQNAGPTVSIKPRASNGREVDPDFLKKPRNVKTFSQSVSPHTDSTKARRVARKLGYTPASSSKKVISNLRGLFHKRSVESETTNDDGTGSIRQSLMPNPLRINPSDCGAAASDNTNSAPRNLIRNPFISPTTPFTATVQPSPYPGISGVSAQQRDNAKASGSADTTPPLPSPAETLADATTLTHSLLDLAHIETDLQRKSHLIQMSKCMVEVVGAARDAEKAMEKAKMEAARAEVSWLKVQKTMAEMVEHVVKVDALSRKQGSD